MGLLFGAVGEAAVGCAKGKITVGAAGAPGDDGSCDVMSLVGRMKRGVVVRDLTLHFLDGGDTSEGPEVGVGDPGEFLFDRLEKVPSGLEARVGTVVAFWRKSHGGTVRSTCVCLRVVSAPISVLGFVKILETAIHVRPAAMPRQSHNNRPVAPIIVVVFFLQQLCDLIVHRLVILFFRGE